MKTTRRRGAGHGGKWKWGQATFPTATLMSWVGVARKSSLSPFPAVTGTALLELILSLPFDERDAFVDQLLGIEPPPPDVPLPRGAVPYLPSGVDEILAMVREAPLTAADELVDLGSGLGKVVLLAHLLTGARARGIELQRHLVDASAARAAALGLSGVSFVHADATELELDGTVFFLYAPFNGELLERVLRRLEAAARRRRIVVCTSGLELDEPWLFPRPTSGGAVTLYESHSAESAGSGTGSGRVGSGGGTGS